LAGHRTIARSWNVTILTANFVWETQLSVKGSSCQHWFND